jgi:hypothetical protein
VQLIERGLVGRHMFRAKGANVFQLLLASDEIRPATGERFLGLRKAILNLDEHGLLMGLLLL